MLIWQHHILRCHIYKIVIEHDMGHKYSRLIKEISRYLLEVAFGTKSSCDVTDNAVFIATSCYNLDRVDSHCGLIEDLTYNMHR